MKSVLLLFIMVTTLINYSYAQKRAFAVTGNTKGSIDWKHIREIDMQNGSVLNDLYPVNQNQTYDAISGLAIANEALYNPSTSVMQGVEIENPVPDLVAALAYDGAYNRLYFTYMHGLELRYIDLNGKTPRQYVVRDNALKTFSNTEGESDVITRMTFAADGFGYASTNDGKHLIRFNSGEKISIKDLGSLRDGKNNGYNSIHTMYTSYGGDMIGDAFGNLYIFTQKGNVFKVNPETLIAEYVGLITNIPQHFTVNGAAVYDKNQVIISCATSPDTYYIVDMHTLEASLLPKNEETVYNASDLASGNLLFQSTVVKNDATLSNAFITVYPNPVKGRNFQVEFNAVEKGNYSLEILDATGNVLIRREANILPDQMENFNLPANINAGTYMFKAVNKNKLDIVYSTMILVDK